MQGNGRHQNKVAVVTGASSGIGLAIARELAGEGARVALGARRFQDRETAAVIESQLGTGCMAAFLDVRGQSSIDAFLASVHKQLGPPAILINSAGISSHHSIAGHSDADWQSVIDVNLTGPFRITRACLPGMIATGWGRIVNISSTAAATGQPEHAAYCASKSGLLGLTRVTALEGAPHGVTAVSVSPTWVETDMLHESAAEIAQRDGRNLIEVVGEIAAANPQNRLVQPEEIAALVSYLCTDTASGLTMEDIQVNAGAHW